MLPVLFPFYLELEKGGFMFVGMLWPLLFFWSHPALRKQTSSKGMKIRNKHLLVSRHGEHPFPQKFKRPPPSLLQVPAQRSLHQTRSIIPMASPVPTSMPSPPSFIS